MKQTLESCLPATVWEEDAVLFVLMFIFVFLYLFVVAFICLLLQSCLPATVWEKDEGQNASPFLRFPIVQGCTGQRQDKIIVFSCASRL